MNLQQKTYFILKIYKSILFSNSCSIRVHENPYHNNSSVFKYNNKESNFMFGFNYQISLQKEDKFFFNNKQLGSFHQSFQYREQQRRTLFRKYIILAQYTFLLLSNQPMIISNFIPNPCPRKTQIIRDLIRNRKIKEMITNSQRPRPLPTFDQQTKPVFKQIQVEKTINIRNEVRKKIYKRYSSSKLIKQYKLQNKYNIFLLNYLNKTSRLEHIRNSPIEISVLDTKNQPSYPFNYEQQAYKKQYPHYSNIVQLPRIPIQEHAPIFLLPTKINSNFQNIYSTTCVTVYQITQFCFRFLLGKDETFEYSAQKLLISERNVKLMYEILNPLFDLDYLGDKLSRFRNKDKMNIAYQKYCKSIKQFINQAVKDMQCSQFIPHSHLRVSLSYLHSKLRLMQIAIY